MIKAMNYNLQRYKEIEKEIEKLRAERETIEKNVIHYAGYKVGENEVGVINGKPQEVMVTELTVMPSAFECKEGEWTLQIEGYLYKKDNSPSTRKGHFFKNIKGFQTMP